MSRFSLEVLVMLKDGLADPQGRALESAFPALGWTNVTGTRVGKHIRFQIDAADEAAARGQAREMAERLLSNPVIEDYRVMEIESA